MISSRRPAPGRDVRRVLGRVLPAHALAVAALAVAARAVASRAVASRAVASRAVASRAVTALAVTALAVAPRAVAARAVAALAVTALAVAALALAAGARPAAAQSPQRSRPAAQADARPLPVTTSQEAAVRRALDLLASSQERAIADWMEICSIPALPRQEAARARALARMLDLAGLPARVLPDGNVEAVWQGRGPGRPAVLSAHLDALHAPGPGAGILRTRDALIGPGVLDDGAGLAAILAAARALSAAGWQPRRELRLLATMGEEIGLVGARSYLSDRPDLAAFVSVDGILGRVDHGATGIRWTRWTLSGPGGHTLLAGQIPSPSLAVGRAVAGLSEMSDAGDAVLNVSGLHGGSAPNAIPEEAGFTVDLRSDDPAVLRRAIAWCDEVVRAAAASEGVRVRSEILQDLPAARIAGSESSPLVLGAAAILRHVGVAPQVVARGSSDHNVAILQGIPAIAVGATLGRGAHSPREIAEIEPFAKGSAQVLLLAVLLGEGLPEAASAQ